MDARDFKSPLAKLVRFFQRSRDKWKEKYRAMKRERKQLANQVRAVEKSRDHWKDIARSARKRAEELSRELADKNHPQVMTV